MRKIGRTFTSTLLLTAATLAFGRSTAPADDRGAGDEYLDAMGGHGTLDRAHRVTDRALAFLAAHMQSNGAFTIPEGGQSQFWPTVANTSLASLAFMAAGYTADQGPYSLEIRRSVDWLMERAKFVPCTDEVDALPHMKAQIIDDGDNMSRMHGHGYATWALAMAYGMSFGRDGEHRRERLLTVLEACVHCTESGQCANGGWGYEPSRNSQDHEGSVTVTQIQALRAARDAGLKINPAVIDNALQYLRNSQIREGSLKGGFRYQINRDETSFALTAAAISSLNQTGVYDSAAIDQGIEFMQRENPLFMYKEERWPWYSRFYASQAFWQYKTLRHFRAYYPEIVEQFESSQNADGGFSDSIYGEIQATAMVCLTLTVPFGYLPSFQR